MFTSEKISTLPKLYVLMSCWCGERVQLNSRTIKKTNKKTFFFVMQNLLKHCEIYYLAEIRVNDVLTI